MLKISGESLAGTNEQGFDFNILNDLAESIKKISSKNIQISIVLGGGNFIRGSSFTNGVVDRVTSDYMGMLATVINSLALQSSLEKNNIPCRVMSSLSINAVCETYIKRRADRHLEKRRVVILASGTGNPFFTTDSAASLRAIELNAGLMLKGTKVDGIYDSDPIKNSNAKIYKNITYKEIIEKRLSVMDTTAVIMCQDHKMPLKVFNVLKPGNLKNVIHDDSIGTIIK